jgi:polyhydroxybutyrate depolymerase
MVRRGFRLPRKALVADPDRSIRQIFTHPQVAFGGTVEAMSMSMDSLPRKLICLALALVLIALALDAQAKRYTLKFDIDGQARKVLVFAPDTIGSQPMPLVLVFHGRGDDYGKFARAVKFHEGWPEAIVAYPRGETIDTTPPMRGWQYRAGTYDDRDLKLTDRLLAELGRRYPTDTAQTYAAGFSNGGHFVFLLLAERNQAFAAFAAVGALQPDYAAQTPPKPFIYLFGRGEDRKYQEDWAQTVKALGRHNLSSNNQTDFADCCRWLQPKPGGAPVVFGLYNAGHIWPRGGNAWLKAFFRQPDPDRDS